MDASPLLELLDALSALAPPIRETRGWKQGASFASLVAAMRFRARAGARRPAVVGLFGGSGVGKSALFNALVGRAASRSFWQRPTSLGVVLSLPAGFERDLALREGTEPLLLPWLARVAGGAQPSMGDPGRLTLHTHEEAALQRVALIDVPDFDSTNESNRALARQLADWVDVAVFVADTERFFEVAYLEHHEACQRAGVPRLLVVNNRQGVDPLTLDEPDAKEALRRFALTPERCTLLPRVTIPAADREATPERVMTAVLAGLRKTPAFAQLSRKIAGAVPRPAAAAGGELERFRQLARGFIERCERRRSALGAACERMTQQKKEWQARMRDSFALAPDVERRGELSGLGVFGLKNGTRTLLMKIKGEDLANGVPSADKLFREPLRAVLEGGLSDLDLRVRNLVLSSELARELELEPQRDLSIAAAGGLDGPVDRLAGDARKTLEEFFGKKTGRSEAAVRAMYLLTLGTWIAGGVLFTPWFAIGAGAQTVLMDCLPRWGLSTYKLRVRRLRQGWEAVLDDRANALVATYRARIESMLPGEREVGRIASLLRKTS